MTVLDRILVDHKIRSDQEFLPAALSIIETPPSPISVFLIWTITLLFVFALCWSYFGRIDIIAVAQGKFQPKGQVKTIQPYQAGRVTAIYVENGHHVTKGDVVIELDPAEAGADEADARAALIGYRAERARRLAALKTVENVGARIPILWSADIPAEIRAREERVFEGDLTQLAQTVKSLDAQISQKKAEQRRLSDTVSAQEMLVATLSERVAMRTRLLDMGAGSKGLLLDSQEALQTQQTSLVTQKGQLTESVAAEKVLTEDRQKAIEGFKAENDQKLAEAERQIDDDTQKLVKAKTQLGYKSITAPINGTVLGLSVTTIGQTVSPSEELMRIVPDGASLEIECYAENKDIGFIAAGQTAVVKIESFPFTRYGVLEATVTRVAHDAIPEPDAQSLEGNPSKTTKSNFFGGAQRTQNLVFPVTLKPATDHMNVDGASIPLSPGMSVSVEIKTGRRRILEYIFSPIVQSVTSAMKER